jgi:hypothetical protein
MNNPCVRIEFRSTSPPEGTITSSDEAVSVEFQGWLGLLAELQQVVERDDSTMGVEQ